jgi:hypothetical protein
VFLPFFKTPYNAAAQGAGMTPAGYASAIKAARAGQTGEAIDRAVRATAGTLGIGAGLYAAAHGLLTTGYPDDATERTTLPPGWKPYSLRVPKDDGAVYVPLSMLGPIGVPLGVAAMMHEGAERGPRDQDWTKTTARAVGAVGEYMMDLSALQGVSLIGDIVNNPTRRFEQFFESLTASYAPYSGLSRQLQQALGDAQRDPSNPLEAFLAQIPVLSRSLPAKQTPLGDPKVNEPTGPMALITGSRFGVEQDEPTLRVLRDAGVSIPPPRKDFKGVDFTEAEQKQFQAIAGRYMRERLAYLDEDEEFKAEPARDRRKLVAELRDKAREDAAYEVLDTLDDDELARRREKRLATTAPRQPLPALRKG